MRWVFNPLGRRVGISKKRSLVRWSEQSWAMLFPVSNHNPLQLNLDCVADVNCVMQTVFWSLGMVSLPIVPRSWACRQAGGDGRVGGGGVATSDE